MAAQFAEPIDEASYTPTDLLEDEAKIGLPWAGSRKPSGMHKAEVESQIARDSERFLRPQLDAAGNKGRRTTATRDYLFNMVYSAQPKLNSAGEVIYAKDKKTGKEILKKVVIPMTDEYGDPVLDAKGKPRTRTVEQRVPEDPFPALYKRASNPKYKVQAADNPKPDNIGQRGWENTPEGKLFLQKEAWALVKKQKRFQGKDEETIGQMLTHQAAMGAARAAHPRNPATNVVSRKDINKGSATSTSQQFEGLTDDAELLPTQTVRGSGDSAHIPLEDLQGTDVRGDAWEQEGRRPRDIERLSTAGGRGAGLVFKDDETKKIYYDLRQQNKDAKATLSSKSNPGVSDAEWARTVELAKRTVTETDKEMADLLDVSSVEEGVVREGMDQPERDFKPYLEDTRPVYREKPGRTLPEGMTGTVSTESPIHGPFRSESATGIRDTPSGPQPRRRERRTEHTGEMPARGYSQSEWVDQETSTGLPEHYMAAVKRIKKAFALDDIPDEDIAAVLEFGPQGPYKNRKPGREINPAERAKQQRERLEEDQRLERVTTQEESDEWSALRQQRPQSVSRRANEIEEGTRFTPSRL